MPVHRYTPTPSAEAAQLIDELANEWRSPQPHATEPVILEEAANRDEVVHVYVVWTKWAHLDRAVRGEIIMEAAERIKPQSELTKITLAMGLTPDEADRFQIRWR